MPILTSQILKSVEFTKIQKSKYLQNETLVFTQIKKFFKYFMAKNSFEADVTFKTCPQKSNKIILFDRENMLNLLNS